MDKPRIVITGVGVVAPNGIGKEEFWKNCQAGVSGIKPITLFDTSKYRCRYAGEISNFQPEKYLGSKGLRNLDRTTLLALVAAKLAIEDAKLEITDENRNDIGVVLGSTMGSVHSISEFDKEGLREGPRYVNPAHFPNTVINSPASQVAIRFGLKGLNTTIATGFTASLDAIGYAMDMLRLGRAKTLLVGGVEELCIQTYLGFQKLGLLAAASNGLPPDPLSFEGSGTLLGEGAVFFVMQTMNDARLSNAGVIADVAGYGTYFDPHPEARFAFRKEGSIRAIEEGMRDAQLQPKSVACWAGYANAIRPFDAVEDQVLEAVFNRSSAPAEVRLNALIGETFSAAGAFNVALLANVLAEKALPKRISTGHMTANEGQSCGLAGAYSPMGASSAVILRCLITSESSRISSNELYSKTR